MAIPSGSFHTRNAHSLPIAPLKKASVSRCRPDLFFRGDPRAQPRMHEITREMFSSSRLTFIRRQPAWAQEMLLACYPCPNSCQSLESGGWQRDFKTFPLQGLQKKRVKPPALGVAGAGGYDMLQRPEEERTENPHLLTNS